MSQNVFIAFQANDDTRSIIDAILEDNPHAQRQDFPAMVKIDAPDSLVVRRASVEERLGRDWDLQELHVNLVSLSGNIDETDDEFTLAWHR
ncbi:MmoB/DmpM family protein [Pigmentiphaga sp. GD03639]|uniref:MmoB/DmpM family protein n=1 Tax=unclassified Pigmentiphaga TaxID=2626614 RepID=UPI000B40ADAB|nr:MULTISPECIES: MmoB/DmpM family protein [unclassified Pigmentiphaga]MDH2238137.1 MmoB/DmpM family protein [Pigmentiphaga sp. GD03639]OVZ64645.1 monooxygenase [Pigmentiphaga sp. NML030171]